MVLWSKDRNVHVRRLASEGKYYISGNWYPSEYRRDQEFRSALGKTALLQWISVFLLVLMGRTSLANIEFVDAVVTLGRILL